MEDNILMKYIAVWGWQLISIMFLLTIVILLALPETFFTIVLSIALCMIFMVTQFIVHKRKKELEDASK